MLPAESKQLLVDLRDRDGEKGICHINSYIAGTRGRVNLLRAMKPHLLQQLQLESPPVQVYNNPLSFSKILLSSSAFFRPNRQIEWVCGGSHHLCIFQVLDDGTNFCDTSRYTVLILVYYLAR